MANNINFQFTADATKVDKSLEGLSRKLDSILNQGDRTESTLGRAFEATAQKAQQLQSKIEGIGSAFQRMQAQTALNNLQGNLQTGMIDQFINKMNAMGVSSQRTSVQVRQLAEQVGLNKNQLQQIVSAYTAYLATLRIGSEEFINTAANLKILQNTFSELDQSISVSGQNMRSQINNSEAGIRSMSVNLASMPQQIQSSFENFTLEPIIAKAKADLDTLTNDYTKKMAVDVASGSISPADSIVAKALRFGEDLKRVKDTHNLTWDEMVRHGVASIGDLKQALISLRGQYNALQYAHTEELFNSNPSEYSRLTKEITENVGAQKQLEAVLNRPDNIAAGFRNISEAIQNAGDAAGGVNPFSKIIAEQKMSVNELVGVLNRLQQTYNNLKPDDKSFKNYEMAIQAVNSQLNQTTHGSMGGTLALQQLGFAVGDVGMLMQNWRGALMGLGNNLPFIAQGIMQLKQEVAAINAAGGAQTTIWKELRKSLAGPAGILVGINLAIAAFQILSGTVDKNAKSVKSFKDIIKELNDALKTKTLLANESVKDTLAEGVAFKELSSQIKTTTAGSKERKVVVDQIQAAYPEYIKNIDLNKASEKELTTWVNNTTAALYGKIKAMLIETLLQDNSKALVDAIAKYNDALDTKNYYDKNKKQGSNTAANYNFLGGDPTMGDVSGSTSNAETNSQKAQRELKEADKNLKDATGIFNKNMKQITATVENVMNALGLDPGVAIIKPLDDPKTPKGDSVNKKYDKLAQLSDTWDKIIAKELKSDQIEFLKYQKAVALWDLGQKTIKDKADFNKAEIEFLEAEKDFALYLADVRTEYEDKITQATKEQREEEDAYANAWIERRMNQIEEDKTDAQQRANVAKKLEELKNQNLLEGMNEWAAQIKQNEIDMLKEKQDIIDNEIYSQEMKAQMITEIEGRYAKKRKKIEESVAESKLRVISQLFGAMSSIFGKHTAAYGILAATQATIDTYAAANVALKSYPPPFNYIAMATAIATGMGNVAQIYSTVTDVKAYAKGGRVNSPHLGLVGEAGPEVIAPERDFKAYSMALLQSSGFGGGNELVATVKGTDLVFVLQKAERKMNRQKIGGSV